MADHVGVVRRGWEAVAKGDWDTLIADYTDDMIFVAPGQDDVYEGKAAFRKVLDNFGAALPPGFEFTSNREIGSADDVVSIVGWRSDKMPDGSQMAMLFRFTGDKICEERWFVDTQQWRAAF